MVYFPVDIVAVLLDQAVGYQVDQIENMDQLVLDSSALGVEDVLVSDAHVVEMLRVGLHDQNYLNLSFDSWVFLF